MIFSGTIPLQAGHTIYGESFRGELFDPHTGRGLCFAYHVERLTFLLNAED